MIKVHYFTYSGHAELLSWTLEAGLKLIEHSGLKYGVDISFVIIDDGNRPCDEVTLEKWKNWGCEYRTSSFRRNGNLNGQECITGILSEFKKSIKRKKDVIVKMDSDTLLLNTDWLENFIADKEALVTASDDRGCFYGMCYAMKPDMVDALAEMFQRCPVSERAQEDIYMGHRARLLAKFLSGDKGFMPLPIWLSTADTPGPNGPHGRLIVYNWHQGLNIAHLYDQFSVINVCNGMLRGQTAMTDVKALIDLFVSRRLNY